MAVSLLLAIAVSFGLSYLTGALVYWLPFQAAIHTPTQIWLGQLQGAVLWQALGMQFFWAALLMTGANWFYHYSLRKVTIPGG